MKSPKIVCHTVGSCELRGLLYTLYCMHKPWLLFYNDVYARRARAQLLFTRDVSLHVISRDKTRNHEMRNEIRETCSLPTSICGIQRTRPIILLRLGTMMDC